MIHDYYIVNLRCSNESIPNREDAVMCPVDRIQQYFGSEVAPWIPWDHGQLGRLRFFRSGQVKYLKDTCWGLEHFNLLDEALLFTLFLIDLYIIELRNSYKCSYIIDISIYCMKSRGPSWMRPCTLPG